MHVRGVRGLVLRRRSRGAHGWPGRGRMLPCLRRASHRARDDSRHHLRRRRRPRGARAPRVMDDPQAQLWEIMSNLGRHARPEGDGSGFLWEVSRDDQAAQVMIEISEAAWSTDPLRLPEATRRALETDGRTELLKVLGHDDPPRVIRCDLTGCTTADQGT